MADSHSTRLGTLDEEKLKELEVEKKKRRRVGRLIIFWKRFRRNKMAIFGLAIILFISFLAVFAEVLAGPGKIIPYGPKDPRAEASFVPPLGYELSKDSQATQAIFERDKTIAGIFVNKEINFINGISQENISYYKQLSQIDSITSQNDETELWTDSVGNFDHNTGQITLTDTTFTGTALVDYRIGGKIAMKFRPSQSNVALIMIKMKVETSTQESRWEQDINVYLYGSEADLLNDNSFSSSKIKGSSVMTGGVTGTYPAYAEFKFGDRGKQVTPNTDYWYVLDTNVLQLPPTIKDKRVYIEAARTTMDPAKLSGKNWNAYSGWNDELAADDEGWLPHMQVFWSTNRFHLFGTDSLGRDILSAIVHGARASFTVSFIAVSVQVTIGVITGSIAGYYGGKIDNLLMRITDIILAIPLLFLILIAITIWEQISLVAIALTIGFLGWAGTARIVRAEFLSLREMEYTDAARTLGVSNRSIIFKHLLPNAMAPVIVTSTLQVATAILIESGLSFLGFGDPLATSWGQAIQWGMVGSTMRFAPWVATLPGIAIFVTVLGFNLMGDGLRDALDPRLKT